MKKRGARNCERYYMETGERIEKAIARIHGEMGIHAASIYLGFPSATQLRLELEFLGIECPWPVGRTRGHRRNKISPEHLDQFRREYERTGSRRLAAKGLPYTADWLYLKMTGKR